MDECAQVCTDNLQQGLPSRIELLSDGYFQHAPDIGPDDPRRETMSDYTEEAKRTIDDYRCKAADATVKPRMSASKRPKRGFGKHVRHKGKSGKTRGERGSGDNGSRNRFSLDVPKFFRNGLASMQHQLGEHFRRDPDQKKSGPKYFRYRGPPRFVRPAF